MKKFIEKRKENHVDKPYYLQKSILTLLIMFSVISSYTQNINGVFNLVVNNDYYILNINDNRFELFSLQNNPMPDAASHSVLKEVGTEIFKDLKKQYNFSI